MFIPNRTFGPSRPSKLALMGVRFIEGPDGATPPVPPVPPVAAPEPPKPGPPAEPEQIEGSADGGKTFDLTYVEKLRKEAAKNRTDDKAAIKQQIDDALAAGQKTWATALGKQLGILEADAEATPDSIIAALTTERDDFKTKFESLTSRDLQRNERDAVNTASALHKGNARLVAAVLKNDGLLKDIDPAADDYAAQVAAVVKTEIEKDASLLAVQVAPSSGSTAPPSGTPKPGPLSIEDRRKAIRENRAGK